MPSLPNVSESSKRCVRALSKSESARYTHDMLISLKKIAALRNEAQLMRLIEAAAEEAKVVSKNS
jgi:hypothetical protein